jgi:hypothetical protein
MVERREVVGLGLDRRTEHDGVRAVVQVREVADLYDATPLVVAALPSDADGPLAVDREGVECLQVTGVGRQPLLSSLLESARVPRGHEHVGAEAVVRPGHRDGRLGAVRGDVTSLHTSSDREWGRADRPRSTGLSVTPVSERLQYGRDRWSGWRTTGIG